MTKKSSVVHQKIECHFIWIVLLFAGTALVFPGLFVSFKPFIPVALGMVMFGIGVNIPILNLNQTVSRPTTVIGLVVIRYIVMPVSAFVLSRLFHLSTFEMMGLLVLGSAPGGTAANVMAYLAGANNALTLLLTLGSTLLSPFVTPALIYLFLNQHITIDFGSMALHIATIVLIPIVAGLFCNHYQAQTIQKIKLWMPSLSILLVALLIACVIALNQSALLHFPIKAIFAVICLNILGYLLGTVVAYWMKWDASSMMATAFDYGMFDGAVAMVICTVFIGAAAAVPAVLMGVIQNLTAPLIIRYLKPTGFNKAKVYC